MGDAGYRFSNSRDSSFRCVYNLFNTFCLSGKCWAGNSRMHCHLKPDKDKSPKGDGRNHKAKTQEASTKIAGTK